MPLVEREVTTPLARTGCRVLKDSVGIFPILRAGLGMAEGIIELLPEAEVWHVGLYRDEATLQPEGVLQQAAGLPPRDGGPARRPDARHRRLGGSCLRDHQGRRRAPAEARSP